MFTVERVAICLLLLNHVDCIWKQCLAQILYQVFLAKPDIEYVWRYLNMILQPIGLMPNAKCLIGRGFACFEFYCTAGEIQNLLLPFYILQFTCSCMDM